MNILEHRNKLKNIADSTRFVSNSSALLPAFDYDNFIKPPITNYIPFQAIQQLKQLAHNPKYMARPSVKFKLMNNILKPYGFRHSGSGTNRRAFYCEYDESIILKVAFDSIGEEANILEYYSQEYIKPFCAKTFSVTPDGILALSERVEPMKEKDYKTRFCGKIFDIIFVLLDKGYIMEDVGGNFYKNWGIRYGFGPVLLDYPYVFKIDWTKLKCKKKDPITGEECLGDLDYDYSRGMSEIVCLKCGTRYSAKHLAQLVPNSIMTQIKRKEDLTMPLINTQIKVKAVRDNKVEKVYYSETPSQRDENNTIHGKRKNFGSRIVTSTLKENSTLGPAIAKRAQMIGSNILETSKPMENENIKINPIKEGTEVQERYYYPAGIFGSIIGFLKRMEKEFGVDTANDLADKLKVKYYPMGYNNKEVKKVEKDKDWKDRVPKDINKLNAFASNDKKSEEDKEKEEKEERVKSEIKDQIKEMTSNEEVDDDNSVVITGKLEEENAKKNNDGIVKPKEGLFPISAMTNEEIEAKEQASRNENAVMGIPGIPVVDQIKEKEMIPRIKNMVDARFNNFKIAIVDQDSICSELSERIKEFIYEDMNTILNGDISVMNVNVVKTVDERNKDCYSLKVENRGTVIFSTILYPFEENDEEKEQENIKFPEPVEDNDTEKESDEYAKLMTNKEELDKYFNKVLSDMDLEQYQKLPASECKSLIIGALYTSLIKKNTSKNSPYAPTFNEAREAATDFVNTHLNFSESDTEEEKSDSVADEL